jgi:hypothetical protein
MKKLKLTMNKDKCIRCEKPFDEKRKHDSLGYCHSCYNVHRKYQRLGLDTPEPYHRRKFSNCKDCGCLFDEKTKRKTINLCYRCYYNRKYKVEKTCIFCGETFHTFTEKQYCHKCNIYSKKRKKMKVKENITKDDLEVIRRLLRRYETNNFSEVDAYITSDLYLEYISSNVIEMGAMPPDQQILKMIGSLYKYYRKWRLILYGI